MLKLTLILFLWHCFTHFSKTTAPQQVILSGKLSTIIIFRLCEFNVNLWTSWFLSYKKYPDPLMLYITKTVTWYRYASYKNWKITNLSGCVSRKQLKTVHVLSGFVNIHYAHHFNSVVGDNFLAQGIISDNWN